MNQTHEVIVTFSRKYALAEHQCIGCEQPFVGVRVKKYCTPECRAAANWRRNGATLNLKRRRSQGDEI